MRITFWNKTAAVGMVVAGLFALAAGISAQNAPAPAGANPAGFVWNDVTKSSGIYEPVAGIMGHGGAAGDFDGDGKMDIFVCGFCDRPNAEYKPAAGPVPNRLFRNLGGNKYEVVKQPGLEIFARGSGAVFADLNNDGLPELYVANNCVGKAKPKGEEPQKSAGTFRSKLYRNDAGKLTDISAESGACPDGLLTARNIGVFDYDGDGLLDLFVVEDKLRRGGTARSALFRNKGNLKFEDVTKAAGLPEDIFGLGLAVADVNGDRRPDIFVPHSNRLWLSQGDGTYREAVDLRATFAHKPVDGEDWPCGAHFADLNNDGLLDLVISLHHPPARNKVYLNEGLKDGVPRFRDVTNEVGLGDPVPVRCPHVEVQDFDNDGLPDIYMSAAWQDADGTITPLVYRNLGVKDGMPRFAPPRPLKAPMVYFPAGPSADFDGDGRLDLFLINWFQGNHCRLLLNANPPRRWLQVRVIGKTINRSGIGSAVWVYKAGALGKPEGLLGRQEITIGYGYAGGQPPVCHFGLADHAAVDVRVVLPNGKTVDRPGVKADQVLTAEEP